MSAKSGTRCDRCRSSNNGMTLFTHRGQLRVSQYHVHGGQTYDRKEVSTQQPPTSQPQVTSPRTECQSRTREVEKAWPRTRVVKRIRIVAVV